uniref:Uncharacterized protein n=1 Tax=Rhizophora mucronata TaxID=61149 RepID=A0A2P2JEX6_RHIMU
MFPSLSLWTNILMPAESSTSRPENFPVQHALVEGGEGKKQRNTDQKAGYRQQSCLIQELAKNVRNCIYHQQCQRKIA